MVTNLREWPTYYLDEDTRLMLKVAKGDERAYDRIYEKYFPIVTIYATSINGHDNLSEDIAQEVFRRIWQQRKEYRPNSTVKTYLFSFSRNVIREKQIHVRITSINQCEEAEFPTYASNEAVRPEHEIHRKHVVSEVNKAIDKLPIQQRLAIKLCYFDNLSTFEAARITGDSYDAFRKRLYRAQQALVDILAHIVK